MVSRWVAVLGLLLAAGPGLREARADEIRLGVLPRLSAAELTSMFGPLAERLSAKTGHRVVLVIPKDFDAFEKAAASGEFDLGFANPFIYAKVKRASDIVPLAMATEKRGGEKFRGILIVRKDSGITDIAALKGKPVIFVDEDSLGGYLAQALLLRKAGLDVQKDVVRLPFAKKHDNVAQAVFSRAAAAGGIREDDLEKMQGKVDLTQISVLAQTEEFPNWPIFATPKLSPAARDAIKSALLEIPAGDAALDAAKLKRFVPVTDKTYDIVRSAAQSVGAF